MSAKLDMALDDVVMTERTARRGRGRPRGRRAPTAARKATAPAGGIQKNTKATNSALKPVVANSLSAGGRDSKIIVSNLPADVTEQNIKASEISNFLDTSTVITEYCGEHSMEHRSSLSFDATSHVYTSAEVLGDDPYNHSFHQLLLALPESLMQSDRKSS
ncbi:MAG: hypothetical protein L6R39_005945 [Caloplaca ligustica]|nr:MAG: hypothetical protein L6R39_005945 [Caloplaca ligustica]